MIPKDALVTMGVAKKLAGETLRVLGNFGKDVCEWRKFARGVKKSRQVSGQAVSKKE